MGGVVFERDFCEQDDTSCVVRFLPKDGSFSEADGGSEILEMTTKEGGGFV